VVHSGGHKVFAGHSEKPVFIDFLERSRALAGNPSLSASAFSQLRSKSSTLMRLFQLWQMELCAQN